MDILKYLATTGFGAALLAVIQILVKGWLNRDKVSAEAMVTEVGGEIQLSRAALEFLAAVRADAEKQVTAARMDAQAQIAAARADAANSVAQALSDVSTARREAAEARRDAEKAESFVRRIGMELFRVATSDEILQRMRVLYGADGTANGTFSSGWG